MSYVVREVIIKDRMTWIRYNPNENCKNTGGQCRREDSKRQYTQETKKDRMHRPDFGAR